MLKQGDLVVVGTDFSAPAAAAVREAARWSRLWGASLLLAHVLDESRDTRDLRRAEAERHGHHPQPRERIDSLAALSQGVRESEGVEAEALMISGSPAVELCALAKQRAAVLLVVGAAGRAGLPLALLGSVTDRVARLAHCPVLVVRPSPQAGGVVGATDFSDASLPALRAAAAVAGRFAASLTLLHCLEAPPTAMRSAVRDVLGAADTRRDISRAEAVRSLADAAVDIAPAAERIVIDGEAAPEIVRVAAERGSGLVVVGTRGRSGLARVLLGSVADQVVREAPCSVLAVRLSSAD